MGGGGTSVRVTWTLPIAVSGASILDFVVIRWRRRAGGHPIDVDDAQDGVAGACVCVCGCWAGGLGVRE